MYSATAHAVTIVIHTSRSRKIVYGRFAPTMNVRPPHCCLHIILYMDVLFAVGPCVFFLEDHISGVLLVCLRQLTSFGRQKIVTLQAIIPILIYMCTILFARVLFAKVCSHLSAEII